MPNRSSEKVRLSALGLRKGGLVQEEEEGKQEKDKNYISQVVFPHMEGVCLS